MTSTIPAHVPASLVRNFNFADIEGESDLYLHYKKLHEGPDFFYTPHFGGHWVATRYEDMENIISNDADFSSRHVTIPFAPVLTTLLEHDGQLHTDFRNLLQPFFTPKAMVTLEKIATDLAISLIDGFVEKGECEFTRDFAIPLPSTLVCKLCEFPEEDFDDLLQMSEDMVRNTDPAELMAAYARTREYLSTKIVPSRIAKPGNDLISAVLHGKVDGGRSPTADEVVNLGVLLIAGGLDTVTSMLGFITMFLARNPGHRQQLIDMMDKPVQVGQALEEFIRRNGLANIGRVVVRDMDYKGVHLKAGDFVLISTPLAGIDERRFPDAMAVDFNRADKKHLSFGRGPHVCIGSFLARTELKVFLREWLKRIPNFEIKANETPIVVPGKANRVSYLPLTWKVS